MPAITVIRADLDDPVHGAAIVACLDAYAAHPMGGSHPLDEHVRATVVEGLRATPSTMVWLARDGEDFVGVVNAFANYSTFAAKPRWSIHDVSVIDGQRGKGIGRALLERVIADATAAGCVAVTLEVRHDNDAARHLYASLGFSDGFAPMAFWERRVDGTSPN